MLATPIRPLQHKQEDLLAELDALVEEETESKLTDVPAALPAKPKPGKVAAEAGGEGEAALPDLPQVPTKPLPQSAVAVSQGARSRAALPTQRSAQRSTSRPPLPSPAFAD